VTWVALTVCSGCFDPESREGESSSSGTSGGTQATETSTETTVVETNTTSGTSDTDVPGSTGSATQGCLTDCGSGGVEGTATSSASGTTCEGGADSCASTEHGSTSESDASSSTSGEEETSTETCETSCNACEAPLSACTAGCVDLLSDPENCGVCDRSCEGSTCDGGGCAPRLLMEDSEPSLELTAQGPFVYFMQGQSGRFIYRIPTEGGTPRLVFSTSLPLETLLSDSDSFYSYWVETTPGFGRAPLAGPEFSELDTTTAFPNALSSLRMNDTHVFYLSNTVQVALESIPKAGGLRDGVTSNSGFNSRRETVEAFEADNTHLYGQSFNFDAIHRVTIADGTVFPLAAAAPEELFVDLALTEDHLVFASNQRLGILEKPDGTVQTLYDEDNVYRVVADAASSSAIFLQALGDPETCSDGSNLYVVEVPSGEPRRLATIDDGCIHKIIYDGSRVFWLSNDGLSLMAVNR